MITDWVEYSYFYSTFTVVATKAIDAQANVAVLSIITGSIILTRITQTFINVFCKLNIMLYLRLTTNLNDTIKDINSSLYFKA